MKERTWKKKLAEMRSQAREKVNVAGRYLMVGAGLASVLPVSAFATDGGGLTAVTSAADTVTTFVNKVFTMMTGNALLAVFMAASLIGVGIRVFRRLRRAAGG